MTDSTTAPASSEKAPDIKDKKSIEESSLAATSAADDDTSPAENSDSPTERTTKESSTPSSPPVVSSSKKSRPPYKYDPNKITLRFLFANRDGLTVTVECKPADTVGEVKGALLSVWPDDLPGCKGGDRLRLICMGKGVLMPDTRTLEDCQVPVFKTHPTPINVSVKPDILPSGNADGGGEGKGSRSGLSGASGSGPSSNGLGSSTESDQGCACIIS
mmetsp:Transcript_94342/g.272704  ORF Transcript_94342/g.272704 Transcript_94342/m.272704 type:complete len:217 (+) Transcript_94342:382-1032(+)|eukprot:CAMPEP_0176010376 /NCGR_PEP_ID=MMETSP0120_2-20121206/4736_1 /TAXON_ID=160619 /ORGANISM="Kryptoperidinium foliaceum, Strain CCMP 1326" /LENGTH=216 /DNA_ID=CAMNT_0017343205 /DNA_START=275 /DNA_END=928 /DNA_ORIENTATION=-